MIRTFLLGTVALATLSTAALAADLPSRRAPPVYVPPPLPVFSWTGFYVGGDVGYGFGRDIATVTVARRGLASGAASPDGIIGGAHMGYNWSTQGFGFGGGGLVVGVEGDFNGTDYRDTIGVTTLRNQVNGSLRGRLGVGVDRALFYVTGGAAFAQFQTTYSLPAPVGFLSRSNTRVGWTIGGGVEYAVTTQWSLRAEYRYADFGTYTDTLVAPVGVRRKETMERATVGFSYKFDAPAAIPVVARY